MWLMSGDSGSPAFVKPRELSDNSRENGEDEHSRPGFLCPVESLNADSVFPCDHSATPDEIFERLPDSWFTLNKKGERVLSDGYKDRVPVPLRLLPNGQTSATAGTPYWFLPGSHTWCLNCGQTHGDAGRDTNRLVGLSGEGRSSATTVLTLSALNLMYANGGENSAKLLGFTDAGHVFDAGHRKVAQTFRHRFHSSCRFDILLTAMLRQSFTNFIFVTNTDGSGKAASYVHALDMLGPILTNDYPKPIVGGSMWYSFSLADINASSRSGTCPSSHRRRRPNRGLAGWRNKKSVIRLDAIKRKW